MGLFKKKNHTEQNAAQNQQETNETAKNVQHENETVKVENQDKAAAENQQTSTENQNAEVAFYINDKFKVKDGGTVVVGQMLVGELRVKDQVLHVKPDATVLGGSTIAGIDQAKRPVELASANAAGNFGNNFGIYLPEIPVEEIEKGNLLVTSSMLDKDKIAKTIAEKKKSAPATSLTEERKNQIGPIIFQKEIHKEALQELSIQETVFLVCSLSAFNAKSPMENFDANIRLLYDTVVDKIKHAETLYITINKATGYPYLNEGFVDIYSKREYALEAMDFYMQRFRFLEVREIKNGMYADKKELNFYAYLYMIGLENIMVDNGKYKMAVKRADLLPPPDFSNTPKASVPVMNPSLRYALNDFFSEIRWNVTYEQRQEVVKKKEDHMIEEICKGKYLVPMRYNGVTDKTGENEVTFKENGQMLFAKITSVDNVSYLPVFTDWMEFEKAYDKKEWSGFILTITDAITIAHGDGIAVNPYGENLIMNEKNMAVVKEECKRLNIQKQ